jgi:SAM-dependent methyltransferase
MDMKTETAVGRTDHGNLQKHQNSNPLQKRLIDKFHQKIGALIQETAVTRLLDAGCGEGFGLNHLLEDGLNVDYMGCDLSFSALKWGKANLLPDLPAANADIHHLPFSDNAFPLVMCLEVLEHIPDSSLGLRELARVSSEYIVVSVPHEPFFRGSNFMRGKHLDRWGNDPEHLHTYSGQAFREMASGVVDILWHGYSFPWQMMLAKKRS